MCANVEVAWMKIITIMIMVSFIYGIQMGALEYAEIKYYSNNAIPELYNESI